MEMNQRHAHRKCIKGESVDCVYDRATAEKAELALLNEVAKADFESFSLAWCLVDRRWQIIAFAK